MFRIWRLFLTFICCLCFLASWADSEHTLPQTIHFIQQSDSLKKEKNYDEALCFIKLAKEAAHSASLWEFYIKSLNKEARIYAAKGKNRKRFSTLLQALNPISEYLPPISLQSAYLFKQLGEIYLGKNNADSSQYYLQEAASKFLALEEYKDYSWCKALMAVSCFRNTTYEQMEIHLDSAYSYAKKYLNKQESIFPVIYQLQNGLYYKLGEYEKALEVGLKVQELRKLPEKPSNYQKYHADDANNLATTYNFLGDHQHALEYHLQALKIRNHLFKAPHKDITQSHINIGLVYKRMHKYKLASSHLIEAKNHCENTANLFPDKLKIKAFQNIASLYREMDQLDSAHLFIEKALNLHKYEAEDMERSFRILGLIQKEKGDRLQALESLEKSRELAMKTRKKGHPFLAHSDEYTAQVYMDMEKWGKAISSFKNAFESASLKVPDSHQSKDLNQNYADPILAIRLYRQYGECLIKIAKTQKGKKQKINILQKALSALEWSTYMIEILRKSDRQELAHVELSERYIDIYELAISIAYELFQYDKDENYLIKAFNFVEKSKAFTLLKSIREHEALNFSQLPENLLEEERRLKEQIGSFEKMIRQEREAYESDQLKVSHWEEILYRKKREYEQFIRHIEKQYPIYYQLKYNTNTVNTEELFQHLSKDQLCISYFWGRQELFAFAFQHDSIQLFRISNVEDLQNGIKNFLEQVSKKTYVDSQAFNSVEIQHWKAQSYQLYEKILAPFDPNNNSSILILPDGPLSNLPYEILLSKYDKSESKSFRKLPYLIRDHLIYYEYSATLLLQKSKLENKNLKEFTGFAPQFNDTIGSQKIKSEDLTFDSSPIRNLPFNQEEVKIIADIMGGFSFRGLNTHKSWVLKQLPGNKILHFATHGFVSDKDPYNSGLLFSSPHNDPKAGFLSIPEIYNLQLNNWLSTLSACNTGRGKFIYGEGIFSLARAFKYAGSRNILMSNWQVDDASTNIIMEDFYRKLKNGIPLAESLREAKLKYLESSSRPHPYFWSSFAIIGKNEVIPSSTSSKPYLYLLLIILLFLGIIAFRFLPKFPRLGA